jgi:hypothetical protein
MPSVSLDSPGLRNIDPGTSHKAAIETKIRAQVHFPKMFEAIKAKGPMPQREIVAPRELRKFHAVRFCA